MRLTKARMHALKVMMFYGAVRSSWRTWAAPSPPVVQSRVLKTLEREGLCKRLSSGLYGLTETGKREAVNERELAHLIDWNVQVLDHVPLCEWYVTKYVNEYMSALTTLYDDATPIMGWMEPRSVFTWLKVGNFQSSIFSHT